MKKNSNNFTFEISLSILNHLGRNLYRNFITVLGEAVSNSWDADADNVWIFIDRDNDSFVIKDDGDGMNRDDFQEKFLKVGYSKRKRGDISSPGGRPYIGAKGIGKLALLSCAEKISIISKTSHTSYIGGSIDNTDLDEAIEQDVKPDEYPLESVNMNLFGPYVKGHKKGTIIHFEQTKENIKNTVSYITKLIALYFRFSLIDESFTIFVENKPVTIESLKDLLNATEFLWNVNSLKDPYIDSLSTSGIEQIDIKSGLNITGFIGTVKKPRDLKITGMEERVGIDLFVNGRLRETDLMKHIPTARIAESYIYGQIHYDELDSDGKDRFTSNREAIVATDDKFQTLLKELRTKIIPQIFDQWDKLRLSRDEEGDDENPRKSLKERRAGSLYNLSSEDFIKAGNADVKKWKKELQQDAEYNIPAYVDCYLSENLVRKYINEKKVPLTSPAKDEIREWKKREQKRKSEANISFDIRENNDDLGYLGMDYLAKVVDGKKNRQNTASLVRDAIEYKPMRNAVGHTSLLTEVAKGRLTIVYKNIKARIITLLSGK